MTRSSILVEAAVESVDESLVAERAGAERLELCANLDVGGTTPDAELIERVKACVAIPIAAMIRPRGGDFVYDATELFAMGLDIDMATRCGVDAIVVGVLTRDRAVDIERLRAFVERASGTPVVFHRAFDATSDLDASLDALMEARVARVLTSGGASTALEGAPSLARLRARGDGRIEILAGGKIRGDNAAEVVRRSGVDQVHARGTTDESRIRSIVTALR